MNIHRLRAISVLAVCILAAISCKKDDDEVDVKYVNGTLSFNLPEFVLPKETITMTPKGLTHPDGKEIGYYWKVTPTMNYYDTTRYKNGLDSPYDTGKPTNGAFTHTFSDTLKTYTVYCYAFSDGYSTSSANFKTTVVEPGPEKSITGSGINVNKDKYITVGGNKFYYTTIGGMDWFKQNLAFTESGVPFRNGSAMDGVFGKFYSYEDAMTACPEGWRLPTDQEWSDMAAAVLKTDESSAYLHQNIPGIVSKILTDAYFNGVKMWEYWPAVGEITNDSGLSIISAGYANLGSKDSNGAYPYATFEGVYEYAAFWTADYSDAEGMAYYRYLYRDQPDLMIGTGDPNTFGASVRCVR